MNKYTYEIIAYIKDDIIALSVILPCWSENMLLHVLKAKYLDSYRLYLEFNNGVKGSVKL
jgi:hypothetical protein